MNNRLQIANRMKFSAGKNQQPQNTISQEVAPDVLVHYEGIGIVHSSAKIGAYLDRAHVSPGWRHATVNVDQ